MGLPRPAEVDNRHAARADAFRVGCGIRRVAVDRVIRHGRNARIDGLYVGLTAGTS